MNGSDLECESKVSRHAPKLLRSKRNRKKNETDAENPSSKKKKINNGKQKILKKLETKKDGATTTSRAPTSSLAAPNMSTDKNKLSNNGKKRSKPGMKSSTEKKQIGNSDVESDKSSLPSSNIDLFSRHKKEFEKSVQRLERLDKFGFFFGEVPSEFDDETVDENSACDEKRFDQESKKIEDNPKSSSDNSSPKPPFNFTVIRKRMALNRYEIDRKLQEKKRRENFLKQLGDKKYTASTPMIIANDKMIDWKTFHTDVISMCDNAIARDPYVNGGSGTLGHTGRKIKELMETIYAKIGKRQNDEIEAEDVKLRISDLISKNKEAAMQSTWRKEAFPERQYERLSSSNAMCSGLSSFEQKSAEYELETALPNCFVGIPYSYDDVGQSEDWMKTIEGVVQQNNEPSQKTKGSSMQSKEKLAAIALSQDDGVVKAQVQTTMEMLLISVQDRVMTNKGVLDHPELISANWDTNYNNYNQDSLFGPEVSEQPVWGIDCYTRQNVLLCLESHEEYKEYAETFVEKWLLPALNACPTECAYDIKNAARILEGESLWTSSLYCPGDVNTFSILSKVFSEKVSRGPHWLAGAARQLRLASLAMGESAFRVHPKGHGAVVLKTEGIAANTMVTQYRGEIYPSWRWGEKMDAIEEVQEKFGLRPVLPDFYNMVLERPRIDPRGYGLLFVDASRKSGLGSSLSHSCSPTCHVHVAATAGKLSLVMTTVRDIEQGEELTFDYNAVTESLNEYMSAVCLCGHTKCRSSFLHYATADCYQQVLSRNSPVAVRLCSLIRASSKLVMSQEDDKVLCRHGFREAVFGAVSFMNRGVIKESKHYQHIDKNNSIDHVPVWLRTYVADVLRYIEYERRALPVALLCNHFKKKGGSREIPAFASNDIDIKSKRKTTNKKKIIENINSEATHKVSDRPSSGKNETVKWRQQKELQHFAEEESTQPDLKFNHNSKEHNEFSSNKRVTGSRPQTSFLYYSKIRRQELTQKLKKTDKTLKGLELLRQVQRLAGEAWRKLSEEEKKKWKKRAVKAWKENGGLEKAKLESERQQKLKSDHLPSTKVKAQSTMNSLESNSERLNLGKAKDGAMIETGDSNEILDEKPSISYRDADAEGRMLLEQRIQALTQTLSRVGRVLAAQKGHELDLGTCSNAFKLHAPISLVPPRKVVEWIWNKDDGVVRSLLRFVNKSTFVTSFMKKSLNTIVSTYVVLDSFCNNNDENSCKNRLSETQARQQVAQALLDLRRAILSGLNIADGDCQEYDRKIKRQKKMEASQKRKKSSIKISSTRKFKKMPLEQNANEKDNDRKSDIISFDSIIQSSEDILFSHTNEVNALASECSSTCSTSLTGSTPETILQIKDTHNFTELTQREKDTNKIPAVPNMVSKDTVDLKSKHTSKNLLGSDTLLESSSTQMRDKPLEVLNPWTEYKNNRYKLEAAADVLLFYAHTNTFFQVQNYAEVLSTPVNVYARELGNDVPYEIIETKDEAETHNSVISERNVDKDSYAALESSLRDKNCENLFKPKSKSEGQYQYSKNRRRKRTAMKFCDPADTITSVARKYSNSYVFFQLLQWFNAGIGAKSDIPDMLGCVMLPFISSCFSEKEAITINDIENEGEKKVLEPRKYSENMRPMLVGWLRDRLARGNPWPKALQHFFSTDESNKSLLESSSFDRILGSPILDLLVTGDDSNISQILHVLGNAVASRNGHKKDSTGENDSKSHNVDQLESTVDEGMPIQAKVNWVQCENVKCMKWRKLPFHVDIDALPDKFYCKDNIWNPESNSCDAPEDVWDEERDAIIDINFKLADYEINARFDVMRTNNKAYYEGVIIETDLSSSKKRVKFHYPKRNKSWDEWIELPSSRIVPLGTFTLSSRVKKKVKSNEMRRFIT